MAMMAAAFAFLAFFIELEGDRLRDRVFASLLGATLVLVVASVI